MQCISLKGEWTNQPGHARIDVMLVEWVSWGTTGIARPAMHADVEKLDLFWIRTKQNKISKKKSVIKGHY